MDSFAELKKLSITSYLCDIGIIPEESRKNKTWFSSPFSSDSSPSFIVYEHNNTFYDWSTGYGGDIITLVQKLNNDCDPLQALEILASGNIIPIHTKFESKKKPQNSSFKNFNYKKYLLTDENEIQKVNDYANSRGIKSDYYCGQFFEKQSDKDSNDWVGVPSVMFLHRDEDLDICGAKFREISPRGKRRFNSRGRLCYHILKNVTNETPKVFVVESETSSNSLLNICKEFNISCFILSVGGVHSIPDELPESLNDLECNVIIDYDGNETLYQERIAKYNHLGSGIKIPLPKGEDINSLYCKNEYQFLKEIL